MLDHALEEMFVPWLEGTRYLESESKNLVELYGGLLSRFTRYHVSRAISFLHHREWTDIMNRRLFRRPSQTHCLTRSSTKSPAREVTLPSPPLNPRRRRYRSMPTYSPHLPPRLLRRPSKPFSKVVGTGPGPGPGPLPLLRPGRSLIYQVISPCRGRTAGGRAQ
jgi:hypothetical protein